MAVLYLKDPALVDVVLEGEGLEHSSNGVGVDHSASHVDFSEKREMNEKVMWAKIFKQKVFKTG